LAEIPANLQLRVGTIGGALPKTNEEIARLWRRIGLLARLRGSDPTTMRFHADRREWLGPSRRREQLRNVQLLLSKASRDD